MTAVRHPANNPAMAEADADRFAWLTLTLTVKLALAGLVVLIVTILVAWMITTPGAIDWSWSGWTVIGDLLTLLAVLAAVVAIKYARDSARAARDTVQPMEVMAANLRETADTLEDMASTLITTAGTMQANLTLAERGRRENRLVHRLEQYERVVAAIATIRRAYMTQSVPEREQWTRDGQGVLLAAVTPVPRGQLPECRTLSTDTVVSGWPMGGWNKASAEIEEALFNTHKELDNLLESARDG